MFQFAKDFNRKFNPPPQAGEKPNEWVGNHSWDPSLLMDSRALCEAATLEEEPVHPNTTPRENLTHAEYLYQRRADDVLNEIYTDHGGES